MIFTSGTQALQVRTVNHDPEPYLNPTCPDHGVCRREADWPEYYAPRPEFEVLDNPILAAFREDEDREPSEWAGALEDRLSESGQAHCWHHRQILDANPTPEQVSHAKRVLTRLEGLAGTKDE